MHNFNAPETFPDMLLRVLGDRIRVDGPGLASMFAFDGAFKYPFTPTGLQTPLNGRAAVAANFQRLIPTY